MFSEASNADIKSRCIEMWSRRIGVFQMLPIRPRGNDGLKQVSTVRVMLKASAALAETCDNRDMLNFCFRRLKLVSNQIQRGGHEHSLLYSRTLDRVLGLTSFRALAWYKKAAEQGDKRAAQRLKGSSQPVYQPGGPGSVLHRSEGDSASVGKGKDGKDCVIM